VACPRRWPIVLLTACSCALAGCGETKHTAPPHLPRPLAQQLAREATDVHTRRAAARLQRHVIAAINAGRVPAELQEELQSRANGVAAQPTRARAFAAWIRANG
jgi:hypothetical protein